MQSRILYTEAFPSGPMRHYFFDYKQGATGNSFVQLTCSQKLRDGNYQRNKVVFFERDLPLVVQALASLCHHAGHLKLIGIKQKPEVRRGRGIPSWEPDMKPRERLLSHGPPSLSDAELLSLLIGSGTPEETAVDLAERILKTFGGLPGLVRTSYKELAWFSGMGLAKSSAILSAIEMATRIFSRSADGLSNAPSA